MTLRDILACVTLGACLSAGHAQTGVGYDALVQQGKAQLQAGSAGQALASGEQAIKVDPARWEAYALAGGALMNLKRYDEAIDDLGKSIGHAPAEKQPGLRDLIKQCVLAESGGATSASPAPQPQPASTSQAEIVLWKTIEGSQQPSDFRGYLSQYPNGAFAVLARQHLADLQSRAQQQAAQQQKLVEQRDQDARQGVWTDPATHLIWAKGDGKQVGWKKASDYCTSLQLAGHSDWRLPTLDELQGIYDPDVNPSVERSVHMKGGLDLNSFNVWGPRIDGLHAWYFDFRRGLRSETGFGSGEGVSALCVRNGGG